jgi:hypothetical protein
LPLDWNVDFGLEA